MVKKATPRASWSDAVLLGQELVNQGLKADEVVSHLKECKYTVQGLKFDATRVSAFVAGARWVEQTLLPMVNTKVPSEASQTSTEATYTLAEVEAMFEAGTLKYTKRAGLHNPSAPKGR